MKKLLFTITFLTIGLAGTKAFAQGEVTKGTTAPINKTVEEVKLHELPDAILQVVTSNFTEHTTASAFKSIENEKEVYLVTYTKDNIEEKTLFNADGTIISQQISGI